MTGIAIPQAPREYSQQDVQQAFSTIENRIADLEEQQNRIWKVTTKKVDETRTASDSVADDAELFFDVEADRTYRFRFFVFFDTDSDADFKFDINGPSSPTLVRMLTVTLAPAASALADIAIKEAFAFTAVDVTAASGTAGWLWVEGILQNGANAGGVSFRWAQNTSDAGDTIVRAGSYVQYGQA